MMNQFHQRRPCVSSIHTQSALFDVDADMMPIHLFRGLEPFGHEWQGSVLGC